MDENDFMKAFMNVDMLAIEGVSRVIGNSIANLYEGMTDAGLDSAVAIAIINNTVKSIFEVMAEIGQEMNQQRDNQ